MCVYKSLQLLGLGLRTASASKAGRSKQHDNAWLPIWVQVSHNAARDHALGPTAAATLGLARNQFQTVLLQV